MSAIKLGAALLGERASVILMELDRATHNPPRSPNCGTKKENTEEKEDGGSHGEERYYIDLRHVAKLGRQ